MTGWARFGDFCRRMMRMPEFWSGAGAVTWGKWVYFNPIPLGGLANYHTLALAIPPQCLDFTACFIGIFQLGMVWWNKRWPRVIAGFLACVFWLTIAHGIWMADVGGPAPVPYIILGTMDFALMLLLCCPRRLQGQG